MMLNDLPSSYLGLGVQFTAAALSNNSTAAAGQLTGAGIVILSNTGGTPGTYTTRTPAQMIADASLVIGQRWLLVLANDQGTGVLTFTAGAGATVGGTATVAINSSRLFAAVVDSLTSITFTGLAYGWTSNV